MASHQVKMAELPKTLTDDFGLGIVVAHILCSRMAEFDT
jgi:hypothetical protein